MWKPNLWAWVRREDRVACNRSSGSHGGKWIVIQDTWARTHCPSVLWYTPQGPAAARAEPVQSNASRVSITSSCSSTQPSSAPWMTRTLRRAGRDVENRLSIQPGGSGAGPAEVLSDRAHPHELTRRSRGHLRPALGHGEEHLREHVNGRIERKGRRVPRPGGPDDRKETFSFQRVPPTCTWVEVSSILTSSVI